MSLLYALKREQSRLNAERVRLSAQLSNLPGGDFRFHRSGGSWKWRWFFPDESGRQTMKTIRHKNRPFAEKLAFQRYLKERIHLIDAKLSCLDHLIRDYPVIDDLTDAANEPCDDYRSLLAPTLDTKQRIREWIQAPFDQSREHPERLNVQTKSGVTVRSKSEAMIADALFDHGIPFRYEQSALFGEILVYPDFTILCPKSPDQTVIWEHFGMIDNEFYAHTAKQKMMMYIDAGYVEGHNLITTYESKNLPLDINYVETLIDYHFC